MDFISTSIITRRVFPRELFGQTLRFNRSMHYFILEYTLDCPRLSPRLRLRHHLQLRPHSVPCICLWLLPFSAPPLLSSLCPQLSQSSTQPARRQCMANYYSRRHSRSRPSPQIPVAVMSQPYEMSTLPSSIFHMGFFPFILPTYFPLL